MSDLTGTEALRMALRQFASKNPLGNCARDVGTSSQNLEAFLAKKTTLPAEVLNALAKYFFNDATYDATLDRLRKAPTPPAKAMGRPPTYQEQVAAGAIVPPKWKGGAPSQVGPQQTLQAVLNTSAGRSMSPATKAAINAGCSPAANKTGSS